jgi:integrase
MARHGVSKSRRSLFWRQPTTGTLFLRLLLYTGMRLSEALGMRLAQVNLEQQAIYLPKTKNNEPRTVHLTPELVAALANHPRGLDRVTERLFRYHASGGLREKLKTAMQAAGLHFPRRQGGFHLFRHAWGTWMRKYAGLDTSGLVETGAWKDRSSAARYEHTDTTEEARKADLLPIQKRVYGAWKTKWALLIG